jgi:putative nucleotidyltransferase with HDIG domain
MDLALEFDGLEKPEWAEAVVQSILLMVKQKDPFTYYHCCRVGSAARKLATFVGMNSVEQEIAEYSGLLHDVGKMSTPDSVLLKPGRLDKDEFELMKSHVEQSVKSIEHLQHVPFFRFLVPGIRYHHEKIDGSGYPFGLKGEKIPYIARLLSVVDAIDAMSNSRPYRTGLSEEKVVQELLDWSDIQFDGNLVRQYLKLRDIEKSVSEDKEPKTFSEILLKAAA